MVDGEEENKINMTSNILPVLEKKNVFVNPSLFIIISCIMLLLFPLKANGEDGNSNNIVLRMNSDITIEIDDVRKSIISLNGQVDIKGWVTGSVVSVGRPVYVQGVVENNVITLRGDIILTEGSAIRGNAVTIGGEILQSHGSMIGGNIKEMNNFIRWNFQGFPLRMFNFTQYPLFHFGFILPGNFLAPRIILMLVMTVLVVALFPKQVVTISASIKHKPWKSIFVGFIGMVCMVPIAAFLGITLVGIPLILIFIVLFMLAGFIGGVTVNYIIGHRLLSAFNVENGAVIWCAISGLVIMEMIRMLPIVAIFIIPFVYLLGLGAVINTRFGSQVS